VSRATLCIRAACVALALQACATPITNPDKAEDSSVYDPGDNGLHRGDSGASDSQPGTNVPDAGIRWPWPGFENTYDGDKWFHAQWPDGMTPPARDGGPAPADAHAADGPGSDLAGRNSTTRDSR
jgi:hypothetical protein